MSDRTHLPALDELRGLAVLVVFVSHAANDGHLPAWLGQGAGQMGVQLFFLLSGYLMMRLYGNRPLTPELLKQFMLARAGRIVPLYWLVIGLTLIALHLGFSTHYRLSSPDAAVPALLFAWAPQELWSIPVEVQFYASFALLWALGALVGLRTLIIVFAASIGLAAIWRGLISEAMILIPYLPVFLAGLAAARLPVAIFGLLGHPLAIVACLSFFVANLPGVRSAIGLEIWSGFYPSIWLDPFRWMAASLLLLSAIAVGRSWLPVPGLRHLGQVSFCVYLIHRPVLEATDQTGVIWATLALATSVAIATASLRWFEAPMARRIRSWRAVPKRRAQQSESM